MTTYAATSVRAARNEALIGRQVTTLLAELGQCPRCRRYVRLPIGLHSRFVLSRPTLNAMSGDVLLVFGEWEARFTRGTEQNGVHDCSLKGGAR